MFYCMFEQSGTFKNCFKELGYPACDMDILNQYNETDYVIDLFEQIENAYEGKKTIFDMIREEDTIIAFYPCVKFSIQCKMNFLGNNGGMSKWADKEKLIYDISLHDELNKFYKILCKFVIVCIDKHIKLIIENPYNNQHYLHNYFPIKPSIVDTDRSFRGDDFKKPTAFWFINRKPSNNLIISDDKKVISKRIIELDTVERSIINRDYAMRFIKEFII